jgi:hypothetical protein
MRAAGPLILTTGQTLLFPLDFRSAIAGGDLAVDETAIGTLTYVVEYLVGYNPFNPPAAGIPAGAWQTIAAAGVAPNVFYTMPSLGPFPTAFRMRATGGAGSVTGYFNQASNAPGV